MPAGFLPARSWYRLPAGGEMPGRTSTVVPASGVVRYAVPDTVVFTLRPSSPVPSPPHPTTGKTAANAVAAKIVFSIFSSLP